MTWTDETGIEHYEGYPVLVYHIASGKLAASLFGHEEAVTCVAFSPDEKLLASGAQNGCIMLWEKATGKRVSSIRATKDNPDGGFQRSVSALTFTSGGKQLVAAGGNSIRVFETPSGKCLLTIKGVENGTMGLVISPDDLRVVVNAVRGDRPLHSYLKVYSLKDGKGVQSLEPTKPGDYYAIHTLDLSADGTTLVGGGYDRSVKIWRAEATADWEREALAAARIIRSGRTEVAADAGSELAWVRGAVTGEAQAAEVARADQHDAEQRAQLEDSRKKMQERIEAKEVAPGTPRAVGKDMLDALVKNETLNSFDFVDYFQPGGFKTWDKMPPNVKDVALHYKFKFVTKAGLTREHVGYIVFTQKDGWQPTVVNIDGSDIPATVIKKGGFYFRN